MIWHHHLRAVGDTQVAFGHAAREEFRPFSLQHADIERHSGAEDVRHPFMEDPRRQKVKREGAQGAKVFKRVWLRDLWYGEHRE